MAKVGDTLYLLDKNREIRWKWSTNGLRIIGRPIIDANNSIYLILDDMILVSLDHLTGREQWRFSANGAGEFSQIASFRRNEYLLVVNLGEYRNRDPRYTLADELWLCREKKLLWKRDIPPNARIQFIHGQVFAIVKVRHRLIRDHIRVPNGLAKAIENLAP